MKWICSSRWKLFIFTQCWKVNCSCFQWFRSVSVVEAKQCRWRSSLTSLGCRGPQQVMWQSLGFTLHGRTKCHVILLYLSTVCPCRALTSPASCSSTSYLWWTVVFSVEIVNTFFREGLKRWDLHQTFVHLLLFFIIIQLIFAWNWCSKVVKQASQLSETNPHLITCVTLFPPGLTLFPCNPCCVFSTVLARLKGQIRAGNIIWAAFRGQYLAWYHVFYWTAPLSQSVSPRANIRKVPSGSMCQSTICCSGGILSGFPFMLSVLLSSQNHPLSVRPKDFIERVLVSLLITLPLLATHSSLFSSCYSRGTHAHRLAYMCAHMCKLSELPSCN